MAKKKTKKIPKLDTSALEGLGAQISGITNSIEEQLKPLMELNNLESHIEKLKKTYETASDTIKQSESNSSEDEGEVCMHGNSWHSGCVECDDLALIDNIFDVVDSTPNDKELGKKIRIMCSEFRKDYPYNTEFGDGKTASEMESIDEENKNSSDDSATKDRKRWAG